jgi:arabinogalactan endo-1,4-beta-galactosidase
MLAATIKAVKAVPNNKGLGVIYWETRVKKLDGYLERLATDWKPSMALGAFKE